MKRLPLLLLALGLSLTLLIAACGDDDDDDAATSFDDDAVVAAVAKALQAKNGWDPATVEVTLDRIEDGRYATGGVRDIPAGGGGLWFAALVDGDWRIVWDGNGVIDCQRRALSRLPNLHDPGLFRDRRHDQGTLGRPTNRPKRPVRTATTPRSPAITPWRTARQRFAAAVCRRLRPRTRRLVPPPAPRRPGSLAVV